jgi:hypothetical protein
LPAARAFLPGLVLVVGQEALQVLHVLFDFGPILSPDLFELGDLGVGQIQLFEVRDPLGQAFGPAFLTILFRQLGLHLLLGSKDVTNLFHLFLDDGSQLLAGFSHLGLVLFADVRDLGLLLVGQVQFLDQPAQISRRFLS